MWERLLSVRIIPAIAGPGSKHMLSIERRAVLSPPEESNFSALSRLISNAWFGEGRFGGIVLVQIQGWPPHFLTSATAGANALQNRKPLGVIGHWSRELPIAGSLCDSLSKARDNHGRCSGGGEFSNLSIVPLMRVNDKSRYDKGAY